MEGEAERTAEVLGIASYRSIPGKGMTTCSNFIYIPSGLSVRGFGGVTESLNFSRVARRFGSQNFNGGIAMTTIGFKGLAAAALIASSALATQAQAATAVYTITGTGTGSYIGGAGGSFTNAAFTLTLNADTTNFSSPPPGQYYSNLTSATIAVAGYSANTFLASLPLFLSSANSGVVSFGNMNGTYFSFQLASPQSLTASFAPVTSTSIITSFPLVGTNNGFLLFTSSSNVQFSGVVGPAAAAVPEPATWAMMIAGFGMVGAGMRRRVTKVSCQTA